ncbi:MAG: GNAT family N-acetyltransferase [Rhodobacterales bacterium]|nr:GNAT family N-acetyltransferase [Rhodobacterales bacterium]
MSTAIHLARPDDIEALVALMARGHAERALTFDDAHRRKAVRPLLDGSPHGAVWLIGPQRAPLGYVVVAFGWSVALAGLEGWIEDVFVRPSVRRRGIGTEVLHAVAVSLAQGGVRALNVRLSDADAAAMAFCSKVGFAARPGDRVMTDML